MANTDFEDKSQEWLSMMRKGLVKEATDFYWAQVYPSVEERFIKQITELKSAENIPHYDYLVLPATFRNHYYALLINALKPSNVIFITSKEFVKGYLPKVLEKTGLERHKYEIIYLTYEEMDTISAYSVIKDKLSMLPKNSKIAVDLTGGKRILVAGMAIVSAFFGLDLVYINDEFIDDIKRSVPGTERLVFARNPFSIFGDLEEQYATTLFKNYDYSSAEFIFKELCSKVFDPREFEVKALLSDAYAMWDAFNYNGAARKIEEVSKKAQQYQVKDIDSDQIKRNIKTLRTLQIMQSSKFDDLLPNEEFLVKLLLDIYLNGERRAKQGKIEDAVSRFYRAIELASQHRLSKHGIITSQPDYSKLPNIEDKYREITKTIYGESKDPPKNVGVRGEIGIKDGHILLFLLGDEIWEGKSVSALKEFINVIQLRDHSIIAHGSELVSTKSFTKIKKTAHDFLMKICELAKQDWEGLLKDHKFVELTLKTDRQRSASFFPQNGEGQ